MTADEILAAKTEAQLHEGLRPGAELLRVLDRLEQTEDFVPEGPFPLSKAYEEWSGRDYDMRRRMLNVAIGDTERELLRRGIRT